MTADKAPAVGAVPQGDGVDHSHDFAPVAEVTRIARMVQQLRNDGEDDAADMIELLSSQRRQHRAKHKSYKRRFREAAAALAERDARIAELERDAADAKRYRWLRAQSRLIFGGYWIFPRLRSAGPGSSTNSAIDALLRGDGA